MRRYGAALVLPLALVAAGCASTLVREFHFDVLIHGGMIYDGSGTEPYQGEVGILGDTIVAVGNLASGVDQAIVKSPVVIDARGKAVAPGFINMLSWATTSLIRDGRSLSDVRQGVTLEVFGEGWSMGPLGDAMKAEQRKDIAAALGDESAEVPWTTLGEYLEFLEERGVSTNVASFVGATTVRIHELGYEDRAPTPQELARMQELVRQAMDEGALGVGSSLIYTPAFFADTDELVALCQVAAPAGGTYISHLRSEGARVLEALDELIEIARRADCPAEIYHLKVAGREQWPLLDAVIQRVEAARAEGLRITADMYPYTAGATGLDASMPPWVQEGGYEVWKERLQDPEIRARLRREMTTPSDEWENLYLAADGAENLLLVEFKNEALRHYVGRTLADVAAERGTSPEETAMDLVVEDGSRVGTIYFLMSEDNVGRKVGLPWVSFGSDAESVAPEGHFLTSRPHPRTYGTFARVLGRYVRDEERIPLEQAIQRMTSMPAENLALRRRGRLAPGHFADVVVFDPETIGDHATFEDPHQLATGVSHVLVNGVTVLEDGEHTGATPGRVVRGPGWVGWRADS